MSFAKNKDNKPQAKVNDLKNSDLAGVDALGPSLTTLKRKAHGAQPRLDLGTHPQWVDLLLKPLHNLCAEGEKSQVRC